MKSDGNGRVDVTLLAIIIEVKPQKSATVLEVKFPRADEYGEIHSGLNPRHDN